MFVFYLKYGIMIPIIKPIKVKEFKTKQSKYDIVGQLPIRSILLAPSGGGKGVLLQNMILDIYRGCFERIYIFSPSIQVDKTWTPVKEYIKETHKIDEAKEKIYFDEYDEDALKNIIETQMKISEYMKTKNAKHIYQILIIIDDFLDDVTISRNSKLIWQLFTRGRHYCCSTVISTQKYRAISPVLA